MDPRVHGEWTLSLPAGRRGAGERAGLAGTVGLCPPGGGGPVRPHRIDDSCGGPRSGGPIPGLPVAKGCGQEDSALGVLTSPERGCEGSGGEEGRRDPRGRHVRRSC